MHENIVDPPLGELLRGEPGTLWKYIPDYAKRSEFLANMIQIGVLSPNEARHLMGLPPIPGDIGNQYFVKGKP